MKLMKYALKKINFFEKHKIINAIMSYKNF